MNDLYLIDTHAHLDMLSDIDNVLNSAKEFGVRKIIIPSVESKFFQKIIDITKKYENIFCQLGIFPSEAQTWDDEILDTIRYLSQNNKIVAIGEIGLDYYWDKSFIDKQKDIFIKQIKLANELSLPIVIHDRDAHKDTIDILKEYNNGSDILFHCFSGSVETMEECIKNGWYIAIGGVVTFKNAKKIKEVAKQVPLEYLMLETDSPYLTPVPYRGKENQPAYIKYVAEEIANIRGININDLVTITTKNAESVFKI